MAICWITIWLRLNKETVFGRHSQYRKELIREGEPIGVIRKVVVEENIDLLLMPAHEESRLEQFLFGRINDALIRRLPCSILLVK